MLLSKKKKNALKYTESPEVTPSDGNPGGITQEMPEVPEPPPYENPAQAAEQPGKRPLTELELNGYFGSSVIVLLQQLTELQRETVELLTKLSEDDEESDN